MKVLVIGGEGYVGSYLTNFLKIRDVDVTAFGNRKNDYNKLDSVFLSYFTHIILLAGHSSVQMCIGPLDSPWRNNVRNFKNLVDKLAPAQTLIYASSASVYGNKDVSHLYTEDEISVDFVNNYDLTKVSLDLLASKYIYEGKKIYGLRFGTVNGGSSIIRRDLMINAMVYTALTEGYIEVTNKHIKRPILSIRDLSRAVHSLITVAPRYDIYNIASFNSTVDQISKTVGEHVKVDVIDKGNSPGAYNFAIDITYFKSMNKFDFEDNIHTIVDNVLECYKNKSPKIVNRNQYIAYLDD
jgi:nucleoside-diphosphate-sugar epimerase